MLRDPHRMAGFDSQLSITTRTWWSMHPRERGTMMIFKKGDVETYTGQKVNVLDPVGSTINIEDIAHALSLQCRFNGHCREVYTIADHCLNGVELMRRSGCSTADRLGFLLHDAAEAYIGDIVTPVKELISEWYAPVEKRLHDVILLRLCPKGFTYDVEKIKGFDLLMLKMESFDLMTSRGRGWGWDWTDMNAEINEVEDSETVFISTYNQLMKGLRR